MNPVHQPVVPIPRAPGTDGSGAGACLEAFATATPQVRPGSGDHSGPVQGAVEGTLTPETRVYLLADQHGPAGTVLAVLPGG
jgi:hypothetical protein